ncbi:MAG: ferritin [Catalinimonas sp.]
MKDLLRQKSSLGRETVELLNRQIGIEAEASSKYLALAAWCDQHGFDHSAEHFYKQSDEERRHMLKLFHYVSDMGGTVRVPATPTAEADYAELRDVFEAALESEIHVTEAINEIVAACRKQHDFATESFLQWYVREQVEEEYVARRALELFDLMGTSGTDLILLDERIPTIAYRADDEA